MDDAMDQLMRDKIADSLKDFHLWIDMIRSGEAEVTGLTIKRKPKQWVGLTDEEFIGLANNEGWNVQVADFPASLLRMRVLDLSRSIENKLREKNT